MNAQSADPDQMEAWVGQALVAESIGSPEAMDLFRHSTQLGYHVSYLPEACVAWPATGIVFVWFVYLFVISEPAHLDAIALRLQHG